MIYSFYTFYLGAPILKKCPQQKEAAYTIVVVISGIVLSVVLFNLLIAVFTGGSMMGMKGAAVL